MVKKSNDYESTQKSKQLPVFKTIQGVQYAYQYESTKKTQAQSVAFLIRSKGNRARVFPFTINGKRVYGVYKGLKGIFTKD